ncbi:septal ring lytic transglycosylase RlpA family protein [Parachitinimonas caeni]|uniref:Endolytic peptidoglycan transglycosylase RlpA n=1 Tax=Parachitinimonas caeni TaxID=3031301 RepID=A0ABT7DY02_9NEIS|nr:septal ring lytic transglycosylase RlpA family protein [Parachitinimonas caeni]MDK2124956.1 septal ring lytic transglycosylase RlpA family protein [Parachitinimonas caeni]
MDVPFDLDSIPEPIPKAEPFHKFANNPYSVLGQSYTPLNRLGELKQKGFASWYGRKFHGQKTSTGEPYDMFQLTAAHPTLPIPSYARVTNTKTGKSVVVRINDRGPFHKGRIIDLSYNAAYRLGYLAEGSAEVEVESLVPDKQSSLEDPIEALAQTLSEPASAPEPQISPGNSPNEKLFVQLAAFSSAASAESFKSKVEYQFAWVKDVVAIQKDERTYRVRIGPYATSAEANLAANRLANSLESKPIVVR